MMKSSTQPSSPWLAWGLWGLLSFFYAFQYIVRVSPSVMISDILQKFCITACEFGNYSGAYYLGYALAHIPLGVMLDRYPIKWVISGSIFLSVAGLVPLIFGDIWFLSVIGRFFVGVGSSGAILSVFKVLQLYFPEKWFSRLLGLSVTIGLLGAIYGSAPVYHLSNAYGWHTVLISFLMVGLVLAFLVMVLVPKNTTSPVASSKGSFLGQVKIVFKHKHIILMALLGGLMVGPLEGFADVWAVPFLEKVYHMKASMASSLPSCIFIGMCVGSPLMAALAEKFQAYKTLIYLSAFIMMGAFIILLLSQPSPWVVGGLFVMIGILCSYQVLLLTVNGRAAPAEHSAFVTALTNMIVMSFGSIYHSLIGYIMNSQWDGSMAEGLPVYSPQAYTYGLMVIPMGLALALIGFLILKVIEKK